MPTLKYQDDLIDALHTCKQNNTRLYMHLRMIKYPGMKNCEEITHNIHTDDISSFDKNARVLVKDKGIRNIILNNYIFFQN